MPRRTQGGGQVDGAHMLDDHESPMSVWKSGKSESITESNEIVPPPGFCSKYAHEVPSGHTPGLGRQ